MNITTKTFAALTALTLAATFALPSNEAHAKGGKGFAIGAGIVGAALVGSAIAASAQPVYYGGGYRSCRWVAQYDRWGNFLGNTKVCRIYY